MNNPIRNEEERPERPKVYVPCAATYRVTLIKVEEKQDPKFKVKWRADGKYEPDQLMTKLHFAFKVNKVEGLFIRKKVTPVNGDKSNLVKFLRSACPEFTEEIRADITKLWNFCHALVGREFFANLSLETFKKEDGTEGMYNKINSITPLVVQEFSGNAPVPTPEHVPTKHDSPFEDLPDITDDQIPF